MNAHSGRMLSVATSPRTGSSCAPWRRPRRGCRASGAGGRRARRRAAGLRGRNGGGSRRGGRAADAAALAGAARSPPSACLRAAWLRFSRCSGISVTRCHDRRRGRRDRGNRRAGICPYGVHEFTTRSIVVIGRGRPERRTLRVGARRGIGESVLHTVQLQFVQQFTCSDANDGKGSRSADRDRHPREWPGVNQAFLFSFVLSTGLALLAIPYVEASPEGHARRRGARRCSRRCTSSA